MPARDQGKVYFAGGTSSRRRVFGAEDAQPTGLGSRSRQLSGLDAKGDRQSPTAGISRAFGGELTFIDLHGASAHYRWDRPAAIPILMLSNGLGTNLTMWDGQIAEFCGKFRVLRYDRRGLGRSSVPPGPYSIDRLAYDVVSLLEQCYFCGLSMGGMIGQWLGVNAPKRLAGLVLCKMAAEISTTAAASTIGETTPTLSSAIGSPPALPGRQ